ncbi:MAG: diaminopimelate epimerase [Betaproteobacteria bacterium]|nr:diaminopimelate epimerase [Betaproteobacteria bacterium]
MTLKFTKMHGAGNDFVVIDAIRQSVKLTPEQVRAIADRHFGVGCDQLLLVERATRADADFCYRIFNADGGEVEQCGNGARCFAHFVRHCGLTDAREIRVETAAGIITPRIEDDGRVTVNMGAPRFMPENVPFASESPDLTYTLDVAGQPVEMSVLSMGNPHAVIRVADTDSAPVTELGAAIECHERFPQRVNVGFAQPLDPHHLRLRVFERGAGETLSCGTGACAAAVAGIRSGQLQSPVEINTRGGMLTVAWAGDESAVYLTGPTAIIFDGELSSTFLS